ncbi:ubiquinol-cytochrome c reductase iron-sulfur subunit [Aeoliella sp. SH292]|uniref:QcrA and Rieske domain-containing protein n=1 Tax=Aeoliella sp. SH292 TaxID=3454464 RepID=UPI003F967AE7
MNDQSTPARDVPRRSFMSKLAAAMVGLGALALATVPGLAVLVDPLRKKQKSADGNWIRVTSLSQLPADGKPRLFPVINAEPRDKWNLYDPQPEKPVFLIRKSEDELPIAFSSVCPHLGCIFNFSSAEDCFICPCHNAIFHVDGHQDANCTTSPRDMDTLDVKVDKATGDVLVDYRRFKQGISEKVAI